MFPLRVATADLQDRLTGRSRISPPLPPPRLRFRVHGDLGGAGFLAAGESCAKEIRAMVKESGLDLSSFKDILDFGCGCGRVLRHLRQFAPHSRIQGTDIDPALVAWCQRHLGQEDFGINPHMPPTRYADGTFDFLYSISVFTHLDEDMQFAWLEELKRIVKPGGHLLLSLHGAFTYKHLPPHQQQILATKGFLYFKNHSGFLKLDGLPDFYQSAYHSKPYVLEQWGRIFEVVRYFDRGVNSFQDSVLLRR